MTAVSVEKKLDKTTEKLLAIGEQLAALRQKILLQQESSAEVVAVSNHYDKAMWEEFKALDVKALGYGSQREALEEALHDFVMKVGRKRS